MRKQMLKEIKDVRTDHVVQTVDRKKRKIIYHVRGDSYQYNKIKRITILGFKELPRGFYRDGKGLVRPAGSFLLTALFNLSDENLDLVISKDQKSSIHTVGAKCRITLKFSDYWSLLSLLRDINAEKNIESKSIIDTFLTKLFPHHYESEDVGKELGDYSRNKLSKVINEDPDILSKLSNQDIEAVSNLHQRILEEKLSGSVRTQIKILAKEGIATQRVYLSKVLEQFAEKLERPRATESSWQKFLKDTILLFNTCYIGVLEKLNVKLSGKYPDFTLINLYNYVDIFEIKKPSTNLLKFDESRENYYWDTEITKAISQTENYIQYLNRNALEFREQVKEKSNLEIKVVRPRGFIIAGSSKQLPEAKKMDDFRLLASSLKNIDLILYDELYANLENLVSRLEDNE